MLGDIGHLGRMGPRYNLTQACYLLGRCFVMIHVPVFLSGYKQLVRILTARASEVWRSVSRFARVSFTNQLVREKRKEKRKGGLVSLFHDSRNSIVYRRFWRVRSISLCLVLGPGLWRKIPRLRLAGWWERTLQWAAKAYLQ